ncbi:bifunctional riboflavin kinase/FAD synthetase [Solirubrobacter soli]|uniref:bifunctional riboflavin kinase/FAD synthetase n=1 Tax=Solirubrobacter soli TaxID=363832 RepID=UPI00042095A5|nr:bifunctional riboflavin kinase/FAD synthetase [Solirubrobacter soli]
MKTVWLPDATPRPRKLAVGEFDGVHAGHREVIRGSDAVLTFEPHPRTVVAPQAAPKLLTTLEQKTDLIAALGVDELIVVPFDGARAAQTAQEFIDAELVARLGATQVSVGENFRFGNKAKGDAALLQAQDAFTTRVVELVEIDGEIVSSTHIRGLIATGAVADAARLLGAPFGMRGIVAHGDKRGRTLGFPTANLVPNPALAVPDHGIYACRAAVPGVGEWTAAVSVGVRPTFVTGRGLLVEAFILDFDGDLYGKELRLDFIDRIRGEKRFESVETLVEQMHRDVEDIRQIV